MNILVIDAQGGGIGKQLVSRIKKNFPAEQVTAIGTNSIATAAMLKAGADRGATGENAVVVACRNADLIVGPVGIIIADAMLGEITPMIAKSVAQASATRILIPFNLCETHIAGCCELKVGELIDETLDKIRVILHEKYS